jgi:hypothetical protein
LPQGRRRVDRRPHSVTRRSSSSEAAIGQDGCRSLGRDHGGRRNDRRGTLADPSDDGIDLTPRWELVDIEASNDGVFNRQAWRVSIWSSPGKPTTSPSPKGPDFLEGAVTAPARVHEHGVLARSTSASRGSCVDSETGDLVAEDVSALTVTWEFFPNQAVGDGTPDRIRFRYTQVGDKDRFEANTESCPDSPRFTVTASAVRRSPN